MIAQPEVVPNTKMHRVILKETFPAILCVFATAAILGGQSKTSARLSRAEAARRGEAKATFESVCASCHGLDARGAERGPDIVSRPEVVHKTDEELVKVLTDGKPASGMPSFGSYGSARLSALVAYLRTLQGRSRETRLP